MSSCWFTALSVLWSAMPALVRRRICKKQAPTGVWLSTPTTPALVRRSDPQEAARTTRVWLNMPICPVCRSHPGQRQIVSERPSAGDLQICRSQAGDWQLDSERAFISLAEWTALHAPAPWQRGFGATSALGRAGHSMYSYPTPSDSSDTSSSHWSTLHAPAAHTRAVDEAARARVWSTVRTPPPAPTPPSTPQAPPAPHAPAVTNIYVFGQGTAFIVVGDGTVTRTDLVS